jgi:hypothetical protein
LRDAYKLFRLPTHLVGGFQSSASGQGKGVIDAALQRRAAGSVRLDHQAELAADGGGHGAAPVPELRLADGRLPFRADRRPHRRAGRLVRSIIHAADPEVEETWKWRGVPVWEHSGIICTGETYKKAVKLTFAKGASLDDPTGLFNSSLDGNVRRAIDITEGEQIDESALTDLVQAAIALNESK